MKQRLAEAFNAFKQTKRRPYRLSASIGLVQAPAADTACVDELLARADRLMYDEKKAGINARLAGLILPDATSALYPEFTGRS